MKFVCDNCGAQYMIADDKIGPKGVKVRCKKCAHVIILRPGVGPAAADPPSVAATPARTIPPPPTTSLPAAQPAATEDVPRLADRPKTPSTAPEPRTLRRDEDEDDSDDEATIAVPSRRPVPPPPVDLNLGVSSDFGLSQEFAARGFETGVGVPATPLREAGPTDRGPSQPFSGPHQGGSLDLVRPNLGDGHGAPNGRAWALNGKHGDVEEGALGRPAGLSAPIPALEEAGREPKTRVDQAAVADEFNEVATSVGRGDDLARLAGIELGVTNGFHASDRLAAKAEGAPRAKASEGAPRAKASEGAPGAGLETLPEEDIGGALRRELEAEDPELSEDRRPTPTSTRFRAETAGPGGSLQSGRPGSVHGRVAIEQAGSAVGENLEAEIGSAFDAVFGGGDPFAGVGGVDAHADDQKATRIFDTDAMQKLQREQDLAVRDPALPGSQRPASAIAPSGVAEWYVAVQDEQVGPLTLSEVEARWDAGDVDANSLCWRQGMADWIAIRFVRELESLVPRDAKPKRGEALKLDLSQEPPTRAHKVREPAEKVASAKERRDTDAELEPPHPLKKVAGEPEEPVEPSDGGWRPSAASALASLAQAELQGTTTAQPTAREPVKLTPSAISTKLPFEPISASMFGAGEQTFTRTGTSLPKTPDLASSVSLRDPQQKPSGKGGVLTAVIIGLSVAFVGALFTLAFVLTRPAPAPVVQAPPPPPPTQVIVQPTAAATPANPPVAPPPSGAPGALAASPEASPGQPAATPTATPAPTLAAAPSPEPTPTAPPRTEPLRGEDARAAREAKARAKEAARERKAERAAREDAPVAEPPPPPARKKDVDADDLLNEGARGGKSTAKAAPPPPPADDLPDQLDESEVLRVIRKNRPDIAGCQEKQAADDPGLEGVMTVSFVVQKSGATSQVGVGPDKFKSAVVGKCVTAAVKNWKFPRFGGAPMPLDFPVKVQAR